jgi:predicted phage terminase large subunit-like protein
MAKPRRKHKKFDRHNLPETREGMRRLLARGICEKREYDEMNWTVPYKWTSKMRQLDPELYAEANAIAQVRRNKQLHTKRSRAISRGKKRSRLKRLAEEKKVDLEKGRKEMTKIAEQVELSGEEIARRELAARELSRRYLIASIVRFNPEYIAGWVHKDICTRLEKFMAAVERGESPRLMLQMPPRHGKSMISSEEYPAWLLGHHPEWELIVCSYAESLALDFSRKVRTRLRDKEYRALFGATKLDPDNQNAQGWKTTRQGGFLPAGVGGAITGKGANVLIIDDPIKNSQEAESETTRQSIMNWYETTAYTRLMPGGGVLIIQTRWHLDDLSGRLEADMVEGTGDVFEVVRYPATAIEDEKYRQRGDPLHEERYNASQLAMIRKAVGERTWAALYQQNPVPDEGAQFQKSMIKYYHLDDLPEQLTKASAWDLAIGQKEINDKTVGFTWGKDIVGDFWFVDCRHGHFDAFEIVNEICDSYVKHQPSVVGIEKDKVSMAVGPLLDTMIEDRELSRMYIEELRPAREGNKLERSRSLQGLMRQGKVWLPYPDEADWVDEFVTELLQFPYGRRDDHVDAAAWLALMAADMPAPGHNYSRLQRRESWRDRLRSTMRGERSMMGS